MAEKEPKQNGGPDTPDQRGGDPENVVIGEDDFYARLEKERAAKKEPEKTAKAKESPKTETKKAKPKVEPKTRPEPKKGNAELSKLMMDDLDYQEVASSKKKGETVLQLLTRFVDEKPDKAKAYAERFEEMSQRHPEWNAKSPNEWAEMVRRGNEEVVEADVYLRLKHIIDRKENVGLKDKAKPVGGTEPQKDETKGRTEPDSTEKAVDAIVKAAKKELDLDAERAKLKKVVGRVKGGMVYENIMGDPDFEVIPKNAEASAKEAIAGLSDEKRKDIVRKRVYRTQLAEGIAQFATLYPEKAKHYASRWQEHLAQNPEDEDMDIKELERLSREEPTFANMDVYRKLFVLVEQAEKSKREVTSRDEKAEKWESYETLEENYEKMLAEVERVGEDFKQATETWAKSRQAADELWVQVARMRFDKSEMDKAREEILAGITDANDLARAKENDAYAEQAVLEDIQSVEKEAEVVDQESKKLQAEAKTKYEKWDSIQDKIKKTREDLVKVYKREIKKNERMMVSEGIDPEFKTEMEEANKDLEAKIEVLKEAEELEIKEAERIEEEIQKAKEEAQIETKTSEEEPSLTLRQKIKGLLKDAWIDLETWSGHRYLITRLVDYMVDKSLELSGLASSKKKERK